MKHLASRSMQEQDLASVMQIEVAAYPQPWSEGIFRDCLKANSQCTLYELEGVVVGYSVMSMAAGEAHLLNLCIRPDYQGRGFGAAALDQVQSIAGAKHTGTLFLEVRVSNLAARRLYESAGFNEIGQRFDYYPAAQGREDALVFAKVLI